MPNSSSRLHWLSSGLFWRTFFLLAFLIAISMAAWIASFRVIEQTPRANQIGAQVISIVTITRAALTHSAPDLRRELLFDLASNEGIRIYPLENTDEIEPPVNSRMMQAIQEYVRAGLGEETRFARNVNGVAGFWVSFAISDDEYWLMLDRDRIEGTSGIQWVSWAAVTLLLSLLGALLISGLINQPLARLATAARAVAHGRHITPLPEKGPMEIRETNRSFNQMVEDLERVESDRALVLAGISHDLRTPLARMQLEVELAGLPDDARKGMQSDLEQMDDIIGQFLDYAKPTDSKTFTHIDLSDLLQQTVQEVARINDVQLTAKIDDGLHMVGNPIEIRRVLNNLVENARRYGKHDPALPVEIDLHAYVENHRIVLDFSDHGNGIPEQEITRLLRPFTRLDQARGQANGAGLGLAIVDRIIKLHGGRIVLGNRAGGGLQAKIYLPEAKK